MLYVVNRSVQVDDEGELTPIEEVMECLNMTREEVMATHETMEVE